ncbi:hypothetical protein FGO68_gene17542 [Halteria grandinella]|uniref:Uncharacterized protein n=1 Tax=Halteria grandinella TaxID=5974 RepID=A0A8J8SYX3_HALGN|nr:hypothetical protein FGO68_gene17542 [Halteria grandinella]
MSADAAPRNINAELLLNKIKASPYGVPYTLKFIDPEAKENAAAIKFEKHFSADLADESQYFRSLNGLLKCVEKNAGKSLSESQQERVCATEYKQLRLAAFNGELFYHNVNKKAFLNELALFNGESAY